MKKESSIAPIINATFPLVVRTLVLPHRYQAKKCKYPQNEKIHILLYWEVFRQNNIKNLSIFDCPQNNRFWDTNLQ